MKNILDSYAANRNRLQTEKAREIFALSKSSPSARSLEKRLYALELINEMGVSTKRILQFAIGVKNPAFIKQLIKDKLVGEIKAERGILTTRFDLEKDALVLTTLGLDYLRIRSNSYINYPELDRAKIRWTTIHHDLDLHITLIDCVKKGLLKSYKTSRQMELNGKEFYKLFDAVGVGIDDSLIGFELERTEKDGRKLDEVKSRLAKELARRHPNGSRVYNQVWYFSTPQIKNTYQKEFSGQFLYSDWTKQQNGTWVKTGNPKFLAEEDVGLIEFFIIN